MQFFKELEDWITYPFKQRLPLLHVVGLLLVVMVLSFWFTDSLRILKKAVEQ